MDCSNKRFDGRELDQLRDIRITTGFIKYPEGSVLIESGDTRVICNASVIEGAPKYVEEGSGWVTAEYSMLPRATKERSSRDISKLKISPRSAEIQRLIGRALRSVVDMKALGPYTITVDCDVIQADGGTRTASITGGFIALCLACRKMVKQGLIPASPIRNHVAAISVGIVKDVPMLDLCYVEDSGADVDFNVIMTDKGDFVELQGTGEGRPFTEDEYAEMLKLARKGIAELVEMQRDALGGEF